MTLPADPLKWATAAYKDGRNEEIDRFEDYLDGKQPIAFTTEKFRTTFGETFDDFAYNRLSSVIEAHADRLQVTGLTANDPDVAQDAQAQWDSNRMDVRENEATGDALSYGDGFVIVEKGDDERVHYWINDPRMIRVHYSSESPGDLDLAVKRWRDEDGYGRMTLYYRDKIERFITRNKASALGLTYPSSWQREEGADLALPVSDTVPVFHLANNARTNHYGKSEVRLLIPLQDAINFVLMSGMVATEFSAFSQKVLMGVEPEDDEEAAQFEKFTTGIDRMLLLHNDNAKIGEFSPSNINMYIDFAEFWDSTVSRVSRVPARYLKMSGGGNESGESKRMDELPFSSKIVDRQRSFGYSYSEIARYGLRLANPGRAIEPGDIRVNWEPASPLSELEKWALVETKVRAGMPFRSAIRESGYDTEQIETILLEDEQERVLRQRYFDRGAIDLTFGNNEQEGESA